MYKDKSQIVVAIAAEDDKGLDGEVSHRFGRCPYFVATHVKDGAVIETKVLKNPHYNCHKPGQMPTFIRNFGFDVVLASGIGINAVDMLQSFGIEVATGVFDSVGQLIDAYLRGDVRKIILCSYDYPDRSGDHSTENCAHH